MKRQRGVTLLELILVVTLFGFVLSWVVRGWQFAEDNSKTNEMVSLASQLLATARTTIGPNNQYPVFNEAAFARVIPENMREMSGATFVRAVTSWGGRLAAGDNTTADPVTGAIIGNIANRMIFGPHVWVGLHDVPAEACEPLARALVNSVDAIQVDNAAVKRGILDPGFNPGVNLTNTCTANRTVDMWFLAF